MTLIKIFSTTLGGLRMINLTYVSTMHLNKNKIQLFKSSEKSEIGGNFLFFFGGKTNIEEITYNTENDAKTDFNEMTKSLEDYYKNIK
jgi:hypothetical protein